MAILLVLSREPALASTLRGELPEHTVLGEAAPGTAPALLILDGTEAPPALAHLPALGVERPARLSDLLYTINTRLQAQSEPDQALPLTPSCHFLPAERELRLESGARLSLTEKESDMLACLLKYKDTPLSRERFLKEVWGYSDDIATRTLDTHLYRLRAKLRQADPALDVLLTSDGGYQLPPTFPVA